jgi:uncharacterized OsmC-like protein
MADKTFLAEWTGGYRSNVTIRDFHVDVDEPESVGGTDEAPTPTELFLASLVTCFTLAVAHAARKRDMALGELSVRIEADYDGNRFAWIRMETTTDLADDVTEMLVQRARTYCFVSQTLLVPPEIEYTVAGGA